MQVLLKCLQETLCSPKEDYGGLSNKALLANRGHTPKATKSVMTLRVLKKECEVRAVVPRQFWALPQLNITKNLMPPSGYLNLLLKILRVFT
jgi:hypothetical protein